MTKQIKQRRSVHINRYRLRRSIADDPRYGSLEKFLKTCRTLCEATLKNALFGPGIQEKKARLLARHFGKEDDYFIDWSPQREDHARHSTNCMREILIGRIIRSELTVHKESPSGRVTRTNLYEEALALASHEALHSYHVGPEEASITCLRLTRDGWAKKVSERVYHIESLTAKSLEEVIEHRVGVEMIQVRRAIRQITGTKTLEPDDVFHRDLRRKLRERRDNCEANLQNGLGYRDADNSFHQVMTSNPDNQYSISKAVQSADQPYMKRRSLLKYLLGEGSTEYVSRIERFNKKQLVDIDRIIEEFKRSRPRQSKIEKILTKHASRQLALYDECESLIDEIKRLGDKHGLAAAWEAP